MGTSYQQLCLEDRCAIARLHAEGRSLRQIAAALDRARSTVSRELKRNIARAVSKELKHALGRFVLVEKALAKAKENGGGRLSVRLLKSSPLERQI